jgi:hypothetical protein
MLKKDYPEYYGCKGCFYFLRGKRRAFGWQRKKADEQRGKENTRQRPAKMLKYADET